MPWKVSSIMSQRMEFVKLLEAGTVPLAELCRRFGISRKTGYKWRDRYRQAGEAGLAERSRRPRAAPRRSPPAVERQVLGVRSRHPCWGGRKIRRVLQDRGGRTVPSASTITAILRRHDRLGTPPTAGARPWQRFEQPAPNDLWQMDFKGYFALADGHCHPLTVLDDHSRYCLGLRACGDERGRTVQAELTTLFRQYGLPRRMLMDNGSPWGCDTAHPWTPLTVWLLRLGVDVSHGRPYHPQTQGKDERFHRTLKAEVLQGRRFPQLPAVQAAFDEWRPIYNHTRPHEALGLATPAQRYQPSRWALPATLPAVEYGPDDHVRRVQEGGWLSFAGRMFRIARAFRGQPVALRPTRQDGQWSVYYCRKAIAWLDLARQTSHPGAWPAPASNDPPDAGGPGGTRSAGSPAP